MKSQLIALCVFSMAATAIGGEAARKPNIVFMMADDLGYGELGCYGQTKIKTPNLDQLAAGGMRFTQHYSGSPVCAPSRCVLMTGRHPGHAHVRDNREAPGGGEGQAPLPADTVTLPRLLQGQGYRTGGFGKWGLGGPDTTGNPLKQGLDRFFGFNCQRHAHSYYPAYLWDNDQRIELKNKPPVAGRGKLAEGADPKDAASYKAFIGSDYGPDRYLDAALAFLRENRERPFFLYFPAIAPHLALHVPEDSVAEYRGKWEETPYTGDKGYSPNFTPRATYAAMITRLDRDIGRLIATVRELGLEENTIFVFTSDNGPTHDVGGVDSTFFNSAGKLRARKGQIYEGGFRVPMIAAWKGRVAAGSVCDRVTGHEDCMPTLLELAGASAALPKESDGISFAPALLGKAQEPRPFLYREFAGYGGQQSVRAGDWKAVRRNLAQRGGKKAAPEIRTELYDLGRDIAEEHDVAAQNPDVLRKLETIMREQHQRSELFPIAALDAP